MALGDLTIYSKDNGFGYTGDIEYTVMTATTVPTILAGEPVSKSVGGVYVWALGTGTVASGSPIVNTNPTPGSGLESTLLVGVATTSSTESSTGTVNGGGNGVVSVNPIEVSNTYLISTLQTATYFGGIGAGSQSCATAQKAYDQMVGKRVALVRTGGTSVIVAGSAQMIGGAYTIAATDNPAFGCVVEELDVVKFPGKVRFSFRNGLSYRS